METIEGSMGSIRCNRGLSRGSIKGNRCLLEAIGVSIGSSRRCVIGYLWE